MLLLRSHANAYQNYLPEEEEGMYPPLYFLLLWDVPVAC